MVDFTSRSLDKVIAFIGERDPQTRAELQQMLARAGVTLVTVTDQLKELETLLAQFAPDIIIISSDLDPRIFDFVRDVRHCRIGSNPFVVITTLVAPNEPEAIVHALQAGTDDIIVKPVREDQLLQRLRRVTVNRQAFVVTSDYLGPDRRGKSRPTAVRSIPVLNTLLEKASGREVTEDSVRTAIDASMNEVLQNRLDSHGYRLSTLCRAILDAYESQIITPDVHRALHALENVLSDAAKTAQRLQETQLAVLCGGLMNQVGIIAERYEHPLATDIALLRKIHSAIALAMSPGGQAAASGDIPAGRFERRRTEEFALPTEIKRAPDEGPVEVPQEPAIEILSLSKGEYLFRQGEPATAAYIVTSGTIAIYRERDGEHIPVAKVRKGEFFGEMAIVDGTQRRTSAVALEDSTLSLVAKDTIEQKLAAADPLVRSVVQMLTNSLRLVHDIYTPRSRHVSDSVREMKEQLATIAAYLESPLAPSALKDESAAIVERLNAVTQEMVALIEQHPELDRRTPALPHGRELPRAE